MLEQIINMINEYIFIPMAFAAAPTSVGELMGRINEHIINPLILVLFALAFVQFTVGLFHFFGEKSGSDKSGFSGGLEQGKRHMLWGIIGMAIMVSVFGIMKLMTSTLGVGDAGNQLRQGGQGDYETLFSGKK